MILFSLSDIRSIADASSFSRGYDYNEASLSEIKSTSMISEGIMQILSVTQGSKLYKQTINVYTQNEGIRILGKCSCPVGKNCKHVISSALAYLDRSSELEENAVKKSPKLSSEDEKKSWLFRLRCSFLKGADESFETSTILLYELHFDKYEKNIELSLFTARQLKGGGYGKVNRARPNSLFHAYKAPEYLRESDKEAILLYKVLAEGIKTTAALRGRLGALVLEAAVKTGRCYWQKGYKKVLEWAEERTLRLKWEEEAEFAQIALGLGEKSYLLKTTPPLYVDAKNKSIGTIETTLDAQQLELLSGSPKVSLCELEGFALELASHLPELEIQAPLSLKLESLAGVRPTPCLALSRRNEAYYIEPGFKYKGFYIKAYPAFASHILTQEKLKIERDLHEEACFIEKIKAYGFAQSETLLKAQNILAWKRLLDDEAQLREEGYEFIRAKGFKLDFHTVEKVSVNVKETSHWFSLGMHIRVEEQELPLLPIITQLLQAGTDLEKEEEVCFELDEESYVSLSCEILRPILKMFYELIDKPNSQGFKLRRYEAQAMGNLNSRFQIEDKTSLERLSKEMRSQDREKPKPKHLMATLRSYQEEGVAWMQFLREYGFGGILADDMGLGKTIQTLAHLQIEKEAGRLNKPVLIVAPTSLLGNWKNEAQKFTPNLKVALYYGPNRKEIMDNITDFDLLITTYTLLNLDADLLEEVSFYYLILDEAQKIKNARSESAKAAKKIKAEHHLALSGTPMENHLGELHSIFDTVMGGFLGTLKEFKTLYQNPIEKERDIASQERLNRRIAPFMLRRTKEKVATELPMKTEMIRSVSFEGEQARLYETIRVSMEKSVRETIAQMGLAKSHISILAALLKLRQVCCDPRLLKTEEAQKITESAKLQMLLELVEELREENRRILIFSQFTTMLEIIEEQMMKAKIPYSKLTGATNNRQKEIDSFTSGEKEVFLISLKAGGVGLNLTSADTVIHYDPWWNPAAQDQATDRAYRIGQDKPVFVYKLIVENSVEEKIVLMQEDKRALADAIYEGKEQGFAKMNEKDLLDLFKQ